jgi:tRNA(Glu) U13 pseudouridine synthase TruD
MGFHQRKDKSIMKLNVAEFQKHVNEMTDEEVRESIRNAERLTAPLFGYKYTDADGNQGEGVLRAVDFVDAIEKLSQKTGSVFIPEVSIAPVGELVKED